MATIDDLKKNIDDIIQKDFSTKGIIFSNESQFQLELASELKEKKYNVELEVFATACDKTDFLKSKKDKKSNKDKKVYIDMVVNLNEKECVAIELKYKTQERIVEYNKNGKKSITFAQGAPDEGSYLFWKDVVRLEKYKNNDIKINFDDKRKVVGGLAIIMANDKYYWQGNDNSLFKEFFPRDNEDFFDKLCCLVKLDKDNKRISGKTAKGQYEKIIRIDSKKLCEEHKAYRYIDKEGKENSSDKPVEFIQLGVNKQNAYKTKWKDYLKCDGVRIDINNNKVEKYEFKYLIIQV